MCGRYSLFTEQDNEEILKMVQTVHDKLKTEMLIGEVFPTNLVPVFVERSGKVVIELMRWGFPNFRNKKGVLINARAETAVEKSMFREAVFTGRCVIPSTGFYEWNKEKEKYKFNLPGEDTLYMAGLWKEYDGKQKFVILTTSSNCSMREIHDRMPLVLRKKQVREWLCNTQKAVEILNEVPPELIKVKIAGTDTAQAQQENRRNGKE